MAAYMTRPCENCPYRKDAPRHHWSVEEFESVLEGERSDFGKTFACHKQASLSAKERGFCAGWLLDQKARGVPSIVLRLALSQDPEAMAAFDAVTADGLEMFANVADMCTANGVPARMRKRWRFDSELRAEKL